MLTNVCVMFILNMFHLHYVPKEGNRLTYKKGGRNSHLFIQSYSVIPIVGLVVSPNLLFVKTKCVTQSMRWLVKIISRKFYILSRMCYIWK